MEDAGARFAQRWSELGEPADPREAVQALLTELLPLDDRRREETIVLGAFAAAAVTGQGITADETLAAPRALVTLVAAQLERAEQTTSGPATSPELDAELILVAVGGITQGMVQGHYTAQSAVELVGHLLDRVMLPYTNS